MKFHVTYLYFSYINTAIYLPYISSRLNIPGNAAYTVWFYYYVVISRVSLRCAYPHCLHKETALWI